MRKIFLLLFTISCWQLNAQFKDTLASSSSFINIKEIKLAEKPNEGQSINEENGIALDYAAFANQAMQTFENEVIVEYWDNGRPIAMRRNNRMKSQKSIEEQSADFLSEMEDLLQIDNSRSEFILTSSETDKLDMQHLRYQQVYKGLRVLDAELILHGKSGVISFANGHSFPTPSIESIQPTLDEESIKTIITNKTPMSSLTKAQQRFIPSRWKSELVIYHEKGKTDQEKLAYLIEYRPNVIDHLFYIVDAHTGKILSQYSGVCQFHGTHDLGAHDCLHHDMMVAPPPTTANALDLFGVNNLINTFEQQGQFYLIDASRAMYQSAANVFDASGLIVTLDAQNTSPENNNFNYTDVASLDNSWLDPTTVSAHVNAGKAFEYFDETFGRNSINGTGGDIISLVHVADSNGGGMDNAFWNGAAMWYGDGNQAFNSLARGLDVAGHEISHGVVQSTANLTYQGESGALNESFADVFGAMIDRDDWTMGEDVVKQSAFPSGALRSLIDPHNGAAPGDYGSGFQPKHVNEQFTGSQDNGGVHINSGIPNHAYYLFATAVGKEKAENVWYRALTVYLTASSQFVDLRIATEKAALDLYSNAEAEALRTAMDQVGILGGAGGNYQEDIEINAGDDFVLMTDINKQDIFIYDFQNTPVKISNKNPISKPSITDNGREIVFIGDDKKMHYILLTWDGNTITNVDETILEDTPVWRNIVISKDGLRLAGLFDNIGQDEENILWIYDFTVAASGGDPSVEFALVNPTTSTDGNTTDDVRYADALEFDITGDWVLYDAFNEISGANSSTVKYWDISFIRVWNSDFGGWSLGTEVFKLFSSLPENVSVGNPTFSKNSPYIIAYEYIDNSGYQMRGLNLETGDTGLLKEQNGLGYPSYSRNDGFVIYDNLSIAQQPGLDISMVDVEKLNGDMHSLLQENFRWGVWFGNGERLTSIEEVDHISSINLFPNPTSGKVTLEFESEESGDMQIAVYNLLGKKVYGDRMNLNKGNNKIELLLSSHLPSGQYYVNINSFNKSGSIVLHLVK